jgi:sodium/proline symporter
MVHTTVIFLSFMVYTLIIVGVGVYSAKYAKGTDEDYFLAGRTLGPWVAAFSASASSESGWVTLGLVGWAFANGVQAFWIIPGCLLGFFFNWFIIAGRMSDHSRRVGALTLPDLFAMHFRERLPLVRVLSVIVITVAMFLYVSAQFAAAGKAFAATFSGLNYQAGVLIGAAVVLIYTVTGGFRAVCWTDFLQALLMVGTLILFPVYLILAHGGYGFVSAELAAADPSLLRFWPHFTAAEGGASALIGFLLGSGALGINLGYPGQPHVLVRFMALNDRRQAWISGVISIVWAAGIYWGAVTVGLFARAMAQAGEAWTQPMREHIEITGELGLVLSAMHLLPAVLSGLVLAAILAAICSTADSQLVVAASAAANDLYARLFGRGGSHLLINRSMVFLLGVGAVLAVIDQQVQVYTYVLTYGWAVLGASFGPQVILLLLWRRATYAGCLAGMLTGFVVAIVWPHIYAGQIQVYNLTLAFALALAVNVAVSLLTPPARAGETAGGRST